MAITLNGTSAYLRKAAAIVSAAPLTMECWVKMSSFSGGPTVMSIQDVAGHNYFALYFDASGFVYAETDNSPSIGSSKSASVASTGAWMHICGVFSASNSRTVYLNGTAGTTDGTSVTPVSPAETLLGAFDSSGFNSFVNGSIAYPGIYNLALTGTDVTELQAFSARVVKPSGLVSYSRLIGTTTEPDLYSATGWTAVGSPTVTANPVIINP